MKITIKMLSITTIIILVSQTAFLNSRPNNSGRNNNTVGRSGINRAGINNPGRNNNQALAAGAVATTNNQIVVPAATTNSSTNDQTTQNQTPAPVQIIAPAQVTQPIEPVSTEPVPVNNTTSTTPENNIPVVSTEPIPVATDTKSPTPQENSASTPVITSENTSSKIEDQEEILKTLETIDTQKDQIQTLFSQSAIDQLFNNFVYFKNFIVENFSKKQMLSLWIELMNQIYPKQEVAAHITIQEKSTTQNNQPTIIAQEEENIVQENIQDNNQNIQNDNTNMQEEQPQEQYFEEESTPEMVDESQYQASI